MAEKKSHWPEVGRIDLNHNAHSQNITVEIAKILKFGAPPHKKADGKNLPHQIYKPFLSSVLKFIKTALKQPSGRKLKKTIMHFKCQTEAIKNTVEHIKYNQETATPPTTQSRSPQSAVHSWANIAAVVPPLPSIQSCLSASITPALAAPKHRCVIIKFSKKADTKALWSLKEPHKVIQKKLNNTLSKSDNALVNKAQITTSKILRSGDVLIYTKMPVQADDLHRHRDKWEKTLGRSSWVIKPTFRVVAYSIPIQSIADMDKEAVI